MMRIIAAIIVLSLSIPCAQAQTKRSVADLIADLKKDEAAQLKALEELETLGEKAGEAAESVAALLAGKSEHVRLQSAMTLGKIGAPAVPALSKSLDGYYALAGKVDPKAVDELVKKLGSNNFVERDAARKQLEAMSFHVLDLLRQTVKKSADLETNRRVEELVKVIEASSSTRFYTVWSIAFIGTPAKSATPMIVKALSDPAPDVRRKAAYTLGRIDADPNLTVNALVAALTDTDVDVRLTASESLPKMSKHAVPVLIHALHDAKKELRPMVIKVLGNCGAEAAPAIPELRTMLLKNQGESQAAAEALAGIGAPAIAALKLGTESEWGTVRNFAIHALHKIGAPAVPTFVDLLGSKHVDVQRHVAALLGGMQVFDKSVVIALGYATKDNDFQVRANALNSIRQMGASAKLAEPYVVALLTDLDPKIRLSAFQTLQALNVDPRPGLKKALGDSDVKTRITTASLMVQLNIEVELAQPILVEALKNKDDALKMQAAYTLSLRGLQEKEVLPIFLDGLKHKLPSVRRQAAESIARYGAKAKYAAPALIEALDDADDSVCAQAMQTVRVIGADPKLLFPAMVNVLRRKDTSLHAVASQTIFQVGPGAVDQIVELLKKEDAPGVRLACLQTLAMVGPPAKDAVPELIKALDDPAARTRMTAARALGNIGPAAKNAEAALAKAEKDTDTNVQQIAKAAIQQIKADPKQKDFEIKGVLTPGDPFDRVRTQHFHVVHTYRMTKGQRYQIDLISQWDNYLRLENALGAQLAADDDGGGYPNARIQFVAPDDGWYRIIVTTFSGGASGAYTLKVK